jgi:hypothetical protein
MSEMPICPACGAVTEHFIHYQAGKDVAFVQCPKWGSDDSWMTDGVNPHYCELWKRVEEETDAGDMG